MYETYNNILFSLTIQQKSECDIKSSIYKSSNKEIFDNTKISNSLNWKPSESFESGLQKTIEWYVENDLWVKKVLEKSG